MVRANIALIVAVLLQVELALVWAGGQDCTAWLKTYQAGTDGPIWDCRQAFCTGTLYCSESDVAPNIKGCQDEDPQFECKLCSGLSKYEACVKQTTDECTVASAFTSKELDQWKKAYGSVCDPLTLDEAVASGDVVQLRTAIGQATRDGTRSESMLFSLARDMLAQIQDAAQVALDIAVAADPPDGAVLQAAIDEANNVGLGDAKIQPAKDALATAEAQSAIENAKAKAQAAIDSAVAADPPVIADLEAAIAEAQKVGLGEEQIQRAVDALTDAQPAAASPVPLLIFVFVLFVAIVGLAVIIMKRRAGKEEEEEEEEDEEDLE